MNKLIDHLKKNKKKYAYVLVCIAIIMVFLMFLFLEIKADDEEYSLIWPTTIPITSFKDIFVSQYNHYMDHSGRTVAHTIVQTLLFIGKPYSSMLSATTYLLTGLLIVLNGTLKKENRVYLLMLVLGLMYYFNPIWDETVNWITGSGNYLWTTMIILFAIKPFINYLKDPKQEKRKWTSWLMLPIMFLAGWTNENMAPTMILFMMFVTYLKYRNEKKLDVFMISSFVLAGIGGLFLILSPGNFIRVDYVSTGLFMKVAYRGHGQINAWFNWLFLSIMLAAILIYVNYRLNTKNNRILEYSLIAWFVVSVLIMVASPSYPSRACMGSFCILLMLIVYELEKLMSYSDEFKKPIIVICFIVIIGFIFTLLSIDLLQFVRNNLGIHIDGKD